MNFLEEQALTPVVSRKKDKVSKNGRIDK